ncbi:hypothetical protein [Streptomyces sp. NPDC001978]|uniref:hypothetical protein n=1 Tax=Streptomyces sp. NPDC001978 TaxID=3364627 RepID=UPI003683B9CA
MQRIQAPRQGNLGDIPTLAELQGCFRNVAIDDAAVDGECGPPTLRWKHWASFPHDGIVHQKLSHHQTSSNSALEALLGDQPKPSATQGALADFVMLPQGRVLRRELHASAQLGL